MRKILGFFAVIAAFCLFAICIPTAHAQTTNARAKKPDRTSAIEGKITATISDIDSKLAEMLETINRGEVISQEFFASCAVTLNEGGKIRSRFNSKSVDCQFYMLGAWTSYLAGDLKTAMQDSLKAYTSNPKNNDARLTHHTIALLAGQMPQDVSERKRPDAKNNSRANGRPQPSGKISSGEILKFDIDAMDLKMLGMQIVPSKIRCLNSTEYTYEPGAKAMCVLLWQLEAKSENDDEAENKKEDGIAEKPSNDPNSNAPNPEPAAAKTETSEPDRYDETITEFSRLFKEQFKNGELGFLVINTDEPAHRDKVINQFLETSQPWPSAMAAGSGADQFSAINIKPDNPIMLIADKGGVVRYAGPVDGFVPKLVLMKVASLSSSETTEETVSEEASTINNLIKAITLSGKSDESREAGTQPSHSAGEEGELTAESLQAQKKLQNAKDLIEIGRMTSYRRGVEMCREVIKMYPDTKYAEEARQTLRDIPEHQKRRYKITDEELGLQ